MFSNKYRNIGLKIAFYRKTHNFTQAQLADLVGISSKYLSRIETGATSGTTLNVYFRICETLGIKFEDLMKEI